MSSLSGATVRRNPLLLVGIVDVLCCCSCSGSSALLHRHHQGAAALGHGRPRRPRLNIPLGTDSVGRQLLPVLLAGSLYTFEIGLARRHHRALLVGTILGFIAGYFGGTVDSSSAARPMWR